jgi:fructose-1,6-bisphosphatase I
MEEILQIVKKSCIKISDIIKNSNSNELGSLANEYNLSGDDVKKLDLMANEILKKDLSKLSCISCIGSEEDKELIFLNNSGDYMVCFDPLDGSSNIDVNITTGTIFAIYKFKDGKIQNGRNIVAAGYCLYGGSTQLIIAKEEGVNMYQLINNQFDLIKENLKIRVIGSIYSINESNSEIWLDSRYKKIIESLINKNYTARWVGSLVADAHRTLLKGGFFSYPENKFLPKGKIRLLYEAYPFAFIFEKARGYASNGKINLLDVEFPKDIHQKTSIILSSKFEFDMFNNL